MTQESEARRYFVRHARPLSRASTTWHPKKEVVDARPGLRPAKHDAIEWWQLASLRPLSD